MTEGPPSLPRAGRHRRESGVTLIEILVSLLLMSFGLLAMGAMQSWSVAGAKTSGHRIVAALLAAEAADMLRANAAALVQVDPQGKPPDTESATKEESAVTSCKFPACTPDALAQLDLASLRSRVRRDLPGGELLVSRIAPTSTAGATEADLWVMWLEPRVFGHAEEGGRESNAEQAFDNCPASARNRDPMPRCFYMRVAL